MHHYSHRLTHKWRTLSDNPLANSGDAQKQQSVLNCGVAQKGLSGLVKRRCPPATQATLETNTLFSNLPDSKNTVEVLQSRVSDYRPYTITQIATFSSTIEL
jgi:hypothetical protein